MQLIAMAMPKGDKWKQKNKYRHQPRSNDDSKDNPRAMGDQDGREARIAGSNLPAMDCPLPLSIDTTVQIIPHLSVLRTERGSHSPITPTVHMPVLQIASDDSFAPSVANNISIINEVSIECLSFQQQDNVCVDSNRNVALVGNERESVGTSAENSCSSRIDGNVCSESVCEQKDIDLCSHPDAPDIGLLPVQSESAPLEVCSLEVDDNMNMTHAHHETLAHLQPQSLVNWSKLLPHAEALTSPERCRGRITVSENDSDDNSEAYASCNVVKSAERVFSMGDTNICKQVNTEYHIPHYCDLSQNSHSEDSREFSNSDYKNTPSSIALLEFQSVDNVSGSPHSSDYNLWANIEPPVWTSLALRENTIHCPEVARVQQQSPSHQAAVGNSNFHHSAQPSVYNNDSPGHASESGRETPVRYESTDEGGVSDTCVFQNCVLEKAEHIPNQYVDGFDVDNEVNSDEDQESITGIKNNSSLTLSDLDCLTRIHPSLQIVRETVLDQMMDEEVTMFICNNDEDEGEELQTYDVVEIGSDDMRPANPVACILDDGGNEHFLPILHETSNTGIDE